MYIKKGKPVFGYKDTFSLDHTLRPIIGAVLLKFQGVIKDKDFGGVPMEIIHYLVDNGYVEYEDPENYTLSKEDFAFARDYWDDIIEELVWSFTTEEPDINNYEFRYIFDEGHFKKQKDGYYQWSISCTNEQESDRYTKDVEEYSKRVQDGYNLFAKYLPSLWW
jgi:hypothetical protein